MTKYSVDQKVSKRTPGEEGIVSLGGTPFPEAKIP